MHDIDWCLSGDTSIDDDEAFDEAAIKKLADPNDSL